ncbi:MAG: hypothetical protein MZV70_18025 [Desulfobacterales bacterium]|nr:hypothetical protein [Desulfobacterales bacterium]
MDGAEWESASPAPPGTAGELRLSIRRSPFFSPAMPLRRPLRSIPEAKRSMWTAQDGAQRIFSAPPVPRDDCTESTMSRTAARVDWKEIASRSSQRHGW